MTSRLSIKERACLELAIAGLSDKQIAKRLELSDRTVSNHLSRAYKKLGVSGRMAAAAALSKVTQEQELSIDAVAIQGAHPVADAGGLPPPMGVTDTVSFRLPPLPRSRLKRAGLVLIFLILGAVFTAGVIAIVSVNLQVAEQAAPSNAR